MSMWKPYKVREYIKIDEFYSMFEANYEKGFEFSGESHNFWECVYVVSGSICVSGDDRIYNMKNNQIIFHKPLEMHKFHIDSEKDAHLFIFSFTARENMDYFENKVFMLNSTQTDTIRSLLNFLRDHNGQSIATIKNMTLPMPHSMYLDRFNTSPSYSQSVVSYIYQLFSSLANNSTLSCASQSVEAQIFADAVNYMNQNLSSSPDIAEISKSCGTSQTRLKCIFTKYSGLGVHKYFVSLKINVAAQLIKSGMTVTEISERLGFSSQGYFSLAFKRETGMSPTEYKKIN